MKVVRALLSIPVAFLVAAGVCAVAVVAWFFPWVLVLHTGFLLYFPYTPDGHSRYARITGPLASSVGGAWTPGTRIPADCKKALIASEDAKFFYHNGLDIESMEKSYEGNQRKGKIQRGGSTITQQLVKNAFLSRDRTYLRKIREVAGALMLDVVVSKENQLAWYFNIVEFGPRVYGIQAAAKHYFKKDADDLDRRECASLVAVLPSPNRWNASLERKRPTRFFAGRQATILARMAHVKLGVDEATRVAIARTEKRGLGQSARLAAEQAQEEAAEPLPGEPQGLSGDPELDAEILRGADANPPADGSAPEGSPTEGSAADGSAAEGSPTGGSAVNESSSMGNGDPEALPTPPPGLADPVFTEPAPLAPTAAPAEPREDNAPASRGEL